MKNYIYVVVIVGEDHNAKTAVIAGDKELKGLSLSKVLAMGYTPIRESAMSGGAAAHSLILLERDGNGAMPAAVAERPAAAERPASPMPAPTAPTPVIAAPKAAVKAAVVSEPKKAAVAAKAAPAAVVEKPAAAAAAGGDGEKKKVSDSDISFDFLNDVEE